MTDHEWAITVDEHDTVIAYKQRRDLTPNDRWRMTSVWVKNSQGQILLAQRKKTKKIHGGLWGPSAAGTVEKGESYEQNAVKELEEELGVTGVPLTAIGSHAVDADGTKRYGTWFVATVDQPAEQFVLEEDAVEQVGWFDPDWILQDLRDHPEKYVPSAYHWSETFQKILAA